MEQWCARYTQYYSTPYSHIISHATFNHHLSQNQKTPFSHHLDLLHQNRLILACVWFINCNQSTLSSIILNLVIDPLLIFWLMINSVLILLDVISFCFCKGVFACVLWSKFVDHQSRFLSSRFVFDLNQSVFDWDNLAHTYINLLVSNISNTASTGLLIKRGPPLGFVLSETGHLCRSWSRLLSSCRHFEVVFGLWSIPSFACR